MPASTWARWSNWCARPRSRPASSRSAASASAPSDASTMRSPTATRISAFSTWCCGSAKAAISPTRKKAGEHIFKALSAYLDPVFANQQVRAVVRHADQRQGNELEAQQHPRSAESGGCTWIRSRRRTCFKANRDRAAPLLAKLKSRRHRPHDRRQDRAVDLRPDLRDQIAGRWRGAGVGRARQCRGYRPRRDGGRARLQGLARHAGGDAQETAASRRRRHRGPRRRHRRAGMHRHRPGASLHGQGRDPRRREFPLLRRQMRRGPRRPQHAERRALEHLDPGADRPGRRDHAVEHAVHAVDLEDRAGARRRLHRRAQAGGMVAGDGRPAGETGQSRPACPTACSTPCTASARKPARR